jgi:hypothetical protein
MLKLNEERSVPITDDNGDTVAVVSYRRPLNDEWAAFQGEMAESLSEKAGKDLPALLVRYGRKLITKVEGDGIPDGMGGIEAAEKFLAPQIAEIGRSMFMTDGGLKLDLGKSGNASGPSTQGSSAASPEKTATSSK